MPSVRLPSRPKYGSRSTIESFANAALGLLVSIAAVHVLRALGAWDSLPAWAVAGVFFCLSAGRARALRWFFRVREARHAR